MTRVAVAVALMGLAQASPAMAMPNAFWIFGFHVPGQRGPKSDIVSTKPAHPQDLTLLAAKPLSDHVAPVSDMPSAPITLAPKPASSL